ncbi:MAG TPA: 3-deoxy-7-phosphoheptulonate synthase [Ktedonobacterales bacterium]
MVILISATATGEQRADIVRALAQAGAPEVVHTARTPAGDAVVVNAPLGVRTRARLAGLPGVARVVDVDTPYQLASRAVRPEKTVVRVGAAAIGGGDPVIIAGPCAVEGEAAILEAARAVRSAGAHILRGGAFKPRTSPYSFQGLGLEGVKLLAQAGAAVGLPVVTEVMEPGLVEAVAEYADILQVGSRNMQNFPLLQAVGRTQRPVVLKRGFAATLEEWLLAAEYILLQGNPNVILCERGIRGFDPQTRNVLDLACVPLLAQLTHLPVMVDPSHATGRRELVVPLGVAAIAAGADGLMVEMHPRPNESLSDAAQTIAPDDLAELAARVLRVRGALTPDVAATAML